MLASAPRYDLLVAPQLRIRRKQDKIGQLLDLDAASDLDRETYLARCKTIEDGIPSISVQAQDLETRLAENPVILPDPKESLRKFQRDVLTRLYRLNTIAGRLIQSHREA